MKLARPRATISDAFKNFWESYLWIIYLDSLFFILNECYFQVPLKTLAPEGREAEMQISYPHLKFAVSKNSKDSRHSAWKLEYLDET